MFNTDIDLAGVALEPLRIEVFKCLLLLGSYLIRSVKFSTLQTDIICGNGCIRKNLLQHLLRYCVGCRRGGIGNIKACGSATHMNDIIAGTKI